MPPTIDILSRAVLAITSSLHLQDKEGTISDEDLKALAALLARIEAKAPLGSKIPHSLDSLAGLLEEELLDWKTSDLNTAISELKSSKRPIIRKAAKLMELGLAKSKQPLVEP